MLSRIESSFVKEESFDLNNYGYNLGKTFYLLSPSFETVSLTYFSQSLMHGQEVASLEEKRKHELS